jgi:hypothetical protein
MSDDTRHEFDIGPAVEWPEAALHFLSLQTAVADALCRNRQAAMRERGLA